MYTDVAPLFPINSAPIPCEMNQRPTWTVYILDNNKDNAYTKGVLSDWFRFWVMGFVFGFVGPGITNTGTS